MFVVRDKLIVKRASSKAVCAKQKGSSLIEVMVALFVLAIGLLGILSMQIKSMQYSQSAFSYAQAMLLANEMIESMRSNTEVIDSYLLGFNDDLKKPSVDCSAGSVCTPLQVQDEDMYQWRQNVKGSLSSGNSAIEVLGDYIAIKIQFDDSRSDDKNETTATVNEYVLVTEIN